MRKTTFTVGRDRTADIPIADPSVSRLHAELVPTTAQQLFVTDCRSSNGTFLIRNGTPRPITQETAGPGDQIRFGAVEVAVTDLLQIIAEQSSAAKPQAGALRASEKLVRCQCGAVNRQGALCDWCKQ